MKFMAAILVVFVVSGCAAAKPEGGIHNLQMDPWERVGRDLNRE